MKYAFCSFIKWPGLFAEHVYSFCNAVKPVHNSHPWDPQKVAVVQRVAAGQGLVQNSRESHNRFSRAGDSGRSLLTGGRCSEVVVSTGLTVLAKPTNTSKFIQMTFSNTQVDAQSLLLPHSQSWEILLELWMLNSNTPLQFIW
jgi:hypothetical protein